MGPDCAMFTEEERKKLGYHPACLERKSIFPRN